MTESARGAGSPESEHGDGHKEHRPEGALHVEPDGDGAIVLGHESDATTPPAVRSWARPKSPQWSKLCGVVDIGASFQTACRGGWSVKEATETFALDAVQAFQCCDHCWGAWVDQRSRAGLRDLVEGTYSNIGRAIRALRDELARFSPADAAGFEQFLGPCMHGHSPITRCRQGCAPFPAVTTIAQGVTP